jgi:hypothetical protein
VPSRDPYDTVGVVATRGSPSAAFGANVIRRDRTDHATSFELENRKRKNPRTGDAPMPPQQAHGRENRLKMWLRDGGNPTCFNAISEA